MATGGGPGKSNSHLSAAEQKEIKSAAEFANSNAKKMEDLEAKFDKMGDLKLFWDSKVPERKKSFFNRVSFKCSDKAEIVKEIKEYLVFYQAMSSAMGKLNGEVEKTELEASDPLLIIKDLKSLVTKMDDLVELGLPDTDSSAVFKLHREFIEKHVQLESLVNRAETICSRYNIRYLNDLMGKCETTMEKLHISTQDYLKEKEGMQKRMVELVRENKKQKEREESLVAENAELRKDYQNLLDEYKKP